MYERVAKYCFGSTLSVGTLVCGINIVSRFRRKLRMGLRWSWYKVNSSSHAIFMFILYSRNALNTVWRDDIA